MNYGVPATVIVVGHRFRRGSGIHAVPEYDGHYVCGIDVSTPPRIITLTGTGTRCFSSKDREHYRLLAYLALCTLRSNPLSVVLDIGTCIGMSEAPLLL